MSKPKYNHQWDRVVGTPMLPWQKKRQENNKAVFNSEWFKKACDALNIEPTTRQARKFNNKKGLVYSNK